MGFEDFEPIIGEPKPEWWKNSVSGSPPPGRFMMHVYAPDYCHLKIQVTDFHSNTFETVKSVVQLGDLRDSMGIGGSWSDFVDYLIASVKSDNVKLVLEKYSDSDDAANAKFFAQKSEGLPLIHISLGKLQNTAASDAISEISFGLFKAYKSMQSSVTQEKEHSLQLTTLVSAEKENSENIQSQLEKKLKSSDKQDVSASLASNGLQGSPADKNTSGGPASSIKVTSHVVPSCHRNKISRSLGYSPFEDEHLCKIYIEISQDPITGTNQSVDCFWSRVEDAYNSSTNDDSGKRSKRSLQCRMQTIEKAVKKLKGCIRQVENYNLSGEPDQDILHRAKRMLMDDPNYKKGFKFDHVWEMMKNFENFKDNVVTRRQLARKHLASYLSLESDNPLPESQADYPMPESQAHASLSLSQFSFNLNDDVGRSSTERPDRTKKAKLEKKLDEKFSSTINHPQVENRKIVEMLEKSSVDQQHQLELQSRNLALQERKLQDKILMRDVNAISNPNIRAYVQAQQVEILQKRGHFQQSPFLHLTCSTDISTK